MCAYVLWPGVVEQYEKLGYFLNDIFTLFQLVLNQMKQVLVQTITAFEKFIPF